MRNRLIALGVLGLAATWAGCSSSTAPGPTFLGSWHVLPTMNTGFALTPDTFTVKLSAAHGDTTAVSMPPIELIYGPNYVFDSLLTRTWPRGPGDTLWIMEKDPSASLYMLLDGVANAQRDTMLGTITVLGTGAQVIGNFVATKR